MNERSTGSAARADVQSGLAEGLNLVTYGRVIWRYRWIIGGICIIAVLTTAVVTLLTPKVYESTTTLFVPREGPAGGVFGGLVALGVLQQVPGLSVPSLTPNRDMLVSILKSRSMAQVVVERFQLGERYRARYLEDAIRMLQTSASSISASKEGVITITVEDTDPGMAADIANFYVQELDRRVGQYGTGEAGRQRQFLTEQLARAKAQLDGSEEALRRFQERNRAIVLQDQTRGAIEAAARLKAEMMAAEVQLQVIRNFVTEANPDAVALRRRITEMKRQLAEMQYGDDAPRRRADDKGGIRHDFSVPFSKVPEVGLELARLTRDVKVHEIVTTLLTQQLEQARIAEAKDLPAVQVLDRATPAERHSRPKLKMNLILATILSAFSTMFAALFIDYIRRYSRG